MTTMETRQNRLEEEGHPEIKKLSTQITELTLSVNNYIDQIVSLETTVKEQKTTIEALTVKVDGLECISRSHNIFLEGIPETPN